MDADDEICDYSQFIEDENHDCYFDDFADIMINESKKCADPANVKKIDNVTIEEIVITMIEKEPIFYDKSYTSKKNINVEKKEILDTISQAIYNIFQVFVSGMYRSLVQSITFLLYFKYFITYFYFLSEEEIMKLWNKLRSKYSLEKAKIARIPSGSSSNKAFESSWPFFKQMSFMNSHIEHRQGISSIDLKLENDTNERPKAEIRSNNSKTRGNKQVDEISEIIKKTENTTDKLLQIVTNKNDEPNDAIMTYYRLIKKGFNDYVHEDDKFDCVTEILAFINSY